MKTGVNIDKVFIDTAPFIYLMEDSIDFSDDAQEIFEYCLDKDIIINTSTITYFEFCVKPYQLENIELISSFKELLSVLDINTQIIDISTSDLAGKLRAKYGFLKAMDALQIASAINSNSKIFITNDMKLKKIDEIQVILVSEWKAIFNKKE